MRNPDTKRGVCLATYGILLAFGCRCLAAAPPDKTLLVVSDPQHVQDTTLRNGLYWGNWNFGIAQFLQVGAQPSTVYDIYRTVSLIRFDLGALPYAQVASAKLRLYVPRNLTQQSAVAVHVHAVSAANANWREGSSEAEEQGAACCWNNCSEGHP